MSVLGGKAVMQRTSPQRPILTQLCHSTINFGVMHDAAFQQ
jgi:hypothetical protein